MRIISFFVHACLLFSANPVFGQIAWINEIHYDNNGTDIGEFVEIGHRVPLNGQLIFLRNPVPGDNTIPATSNFDLSGLLPSSTVGNINYTVVDVPLSDGPAGFRLTIRNQGIVQTLSYEGPLVARFETSADVGIIESATTPVGYSIQKCPESNRWVGPIPNTKGRQNRRCNSQSPSTEPSSKPSISPTETPSHNPTYQPSFEPSSGPTNRPSAKPSTAPTETPSHIPTFLPSFEPSRVPSSQPSISPTKKPSLIPSVLPSFQPSRDPTHAPSAAPSLLPVTAPCGLFGWSIFCPRTRCGWIGRFLQWCDRV